MAGDIIVTGVRNTDGSTTLYRHEVGSSVWTRVDIDALGNASETASSTPPPAFADDPNDASDTVKLKVSNPANLAEAQQAAANILNALNIIKTELSSEDPGARLVINGRVTTAGAELAHIKTIEFSVTDDPAISSTGQSAVDHNREGGNHTVEMYFEQFDGDGVQDYASPNYTNSQGMVAIILHEISHTTRQHDDFNIRSYQLHLRANQVNDKTDVDVDWGWGSKFFVNNESFGNSYAVQMAAALGVSLEQWKPAQPTTYVDPQSIFDQTVIEGAFAQLSVAQQPGAMSPAEALIQPSFDQIIG